MISWLKRRKIKKILEEMVKAKEEGKDVIVESIEEIKIDDLKRKTCHIVDRIKILIDDKEIAEFDDYEYKQIFFEEIDNLKIHGFGLFYVGTEERFLEKINIYRFA